MSKCGECYYEGKELNPCNNCFNGDKAKVVWTNADRIREMSDEELANIISELVLRALHFYCDTETLEKIDFRRNVEIDMKLDWLRSEVEGT